MKLFFRFIVACGIVVGSGLSVSAAPKTVRANGELIEVETNKQGRALFRVPLRGNTTSYLSLDVFGPKIRKIRAKAQQAPLRRRGKKRPSWNIPFISGEKLVNAVDERGCLQFAIATEDDKEEEKEQEDLLFPPLEELDLDPVTFQVLRLLLEQLANELAGYTGDDRCSVVSDGLKTQITAAFLVAFQGDWSEEETCELINSSYLEVAFQYFGLTPSEEFTQKSAVSVRSRAPLSLQSFGAVMRKDACQQVGNKPSYYVAVAIKLAKKGNTPLQIRLSERNYEGNTGATMKPVSEGRFAPNPLLLMETMRACGQVLSEVAWRRGRPKVRNLPLADIITFRGRFFNRTDMGGELRGGQASYDLEDGSSAYGVCFQKSAVRQVVNGYPFP